MATVLRDEQVWWELEILLMASGVVLFCSAVVLEEKLSAQRQDVGSECERLRKEDKMCNS